MPHDSATFSDVALAAVRQVVMSVGAALGRAAGAVDREFNVLACSAQVSPLRGTGQLASRVRQLGGFASLRPIELPADPTLAMPATLWVPIRGGGQLLGLLWIACPDASLSREETERAKLAAREVANALRYGCPDGDALTRAALGTDPQARQWAVRRILEEQPHLDSLGVVALVAGRVGEVIQPPNVMEHRLHMIAEDHVAVLMPCRSSDLDTLTNRLAAKVNGVIGVGQWYPHLRFAHETYQEALGAARVAARLADLGRVVRWTALGVYRTFAHLPEGTLEHNSIHPGLEQLFTEPAHQQLLDTLETYLDLAGNVPLAAQRLHLHRASLYYRLRRVEQLLQADLRDGHQRLCLHMAFKFGRFTGRYPDSRCARHSRLNMGLAGHRARPIPVGRRKAQ